MDKNQIDTPIELRGYVFLRWKLNSVRYVNFIPIGKSVCVFIVVNANDAVIRIGVAKVSPSLLE